MATVPSLSEPSTSSYKAAVDHFLQTGSRNDLMTQEQEEISLPDVPESQTHSLQELMGSAKSLTAREDLLCTLRSESLFLITLNQSGSWCSGVLRSAQSVCVSCLRKQLNMKYVSFFIMLNLRHGLFSQ